MARKILQKKEVLNNKKLFSYLAVFVILVLSFVVIYFSNSIVGKSILNVESLEDGEMIISLNKGELIPSDTDIELISNGKTQSYKLSDLVSEQENSGKFFISDKQVSGNGSGYGLVGEKTVYPEVEFTMKIIEESQDSGESSGDNSVNDTSSSDSGDSNDTSSSDSGDSNDTSTSNLGDEENQTEENQTEENQTEESQTEKNQTGEGSSITGNAVQTQVDVVEDVVSANSPFEYELSEGQSAEIVSSEEDVELSISDGIAIITTDYSETHEGFGEEFLQDETYDLSIDLNPLNVSSEDFSVKLIYSGEEIESFSKDSGDSQNSEDNETDRIDNETELIDNETELIDNETELIDNETIESNLTTNETKDNQTLENLSEYDLTEKESFLVQSKTGEKKVSVTKSEIVSNRLVVRFEIGDYWLEKSYNPDRENLDDEVKLDRVKWIKQIANSLKENSEKTEEVEEYIGDYSI